MPTLPAWRAENHGIAVIDSSFEMRVSDTRTEKAGDLVPAISVFVDPSRILVKKYRIEDVRIHALARIKSSVPTDVSASMTGEQGPFEGRFSAFIADLVTL
jgi:hypothetical protein